MPTALTDRPVLAFKEPLYSLQAGRAFAAITVLLLHADRIIGAPMFGGAMFAHFWFSGGRLGVDFFFALSGFIILHAHAADIGRPAKLGHYLYRRASRIYPIYWVILTLFVLPNLLVRHSFDFWDILRNYSLIDLYERDRILTVSWTLFHELLFYLAFAILILNRWLGAIVLAGWLLAVLWFQGRAGTPDVVTAPINLCFAAGMLASFCAHRLPPRIFPLPLLLGSLGLAYLVWAAHAALLENAPEGAPAALFCGLMVMGLAKADCAKAWTVPRWLIFLGAASYSIYLIQGAALSAAAELLMLVNGMRMLPLALVVILLTAAGVAIGSLCYRLIERPLLHRARQG